MPAAEIGGRFAVKARSLAETEKDEKNRVYISITYIDEISILGVTLKELRFTVERRASEVEEPW